MRIVVLDGYTLNPGDLSWEGLESIGDLTVYDRTAPDQVVAQACNADDGCNHAVGILVLSTAAWAR